MLLRVGLWFLTGVETSVGVVATFLPQVFYERVPWVALTPPFSEHLMRDYGTMNLALALVVGVAAVTMNRLAVRTALCALLLFAIPHLVFHATHLAHFGATAAVSELVSLTVAALIPAGLLLMTHQCQQSNINVYL